MKSVFAILALAVVALYGCNGNDPNEGLNGAPNNDSNPESVDVRSLKDMVVEGEQQFTAPHITVDNCTVVDGSKLVLTASKSVTINAPFEVEEGGELEITTQEAQ
ncbi:MAG: hypothetical protein IJ348_02000 [Alistipes sp.]|nr:hypothetical protein [Alistipes sp.]